MYDDALVLGHDLFHYFLMICVDIPILLHFDFFYIYIARGDNLGFYKNSYACVYRNMNYAPLYLTLIDQSDELVMM